MLFRVAFRLERAAILAVALRAEHPRGVAQMKRIVAAVLLSLVPAVAFAQDDEISALAQTVTRSFGACVDVVPYGYQDGCSLGHAAAKGRLLPLGISSEKDACHTFLDHIWSDPPAPAETMQRCLDGYRMGKTIAERESSR